MSISVIVIVGATFLNPLNGSIQHIIGYVDTPQECAHMLNTNHTVDTPEGLLYMTEAFCQGAYLDEQGNIDLDGGK